MVRIKGKVPQSREWSSTLPYTLVWKLLKREPSGHPWLRLPTLLLSQTIQFCVSTVSMLKTILFSISTQFSSIWLIDRALSGATTLGQNGPESNGNEGVLCIPQNSSITRTLPSDLFSVISRTLVGAGIYLSAEMQLVFYSPSQLGNMI